MNQLRKVNLIVPGQHVVNRDWAKSLAQQLRIECNSLDYPWWHESDGEINVEEIKSRIAAIQPDIVIAKSIGTLLTSFALQDRLIAPRLLVIMGVPLKSISAEEVEIIRSVQDIDDLSVLVIQQTSDCLGSYSDVAHLFGRSNVSLAEVPGDDHMYADFEEMARLIDHWLSEHG